MKLWKKVLREEVVVDKNQIEKLQKADDLVKFMKRLSKILFNLSELAPQGKNLPNDQNFLKRWELWKKIVEARKQELPLADSYMRKILVSQLRDHRLIHGERKQQRKQQLKNAKARYLQKKNQEIENVPFTPTPVFIEEGE
jgi:acetyl-CoA carboxylase alpha subunit